MKIIYELFKSKNPSFRIRKHFSCLLPSKIITAHS
jgi:hypothetical protein